MTESLKQLAEKQGVSRQRVHQRNSGYGVILKQLEQGGAYAQIHATVINRDGGECTACGSNEDLIVHHKDGNDRNNEVGNLITLCRSCHVKTHDISVRSPYKRKIVNWRLRADLLERLEAEAGQNGFRSAVPLIEDILCKY